jgi:hypothetical protein
LQELSRKYHHDREWIQAQIRQYQPKHIAPTPQEVTLVIDATFFGKRTDQFGMLVAKDTFSGEPIWYHFIQTESLKEYAYMKQELRAQGFHIQAVTMDGKRGLYGLFHDVPVQMCHFHQQAIITRYLTRKPKLKAAIDLKRIAAYLGKCHRNRFEKLLCAWHARHQHFLDEKVEDDSKRGWHYKHKRLRSAYRSLQTNLPYLFTYKHYPQLQIHNTTNALDGGLFSPLKTLLKIHRGIGVEMKKKMIMDYMQKQVKKQPGNPL